MRMAIVLLIVVVLFGASPSIAQQDGGIDGMVRPSVLDFLDAYDASVARGGVPMAGTWVGSMIMAGMVVPDAVAITIIIRDNGVWVGPGGTSGRVELGEFGLSEEIILVGAYGEGALKNKVIRYMLRRTGSQLVGTARITGTPNDLTVTLNKK